MTAFWTIALAVGTFLLVAGAGFAAYFAWRTWTSTRGQLAAANGQLYAANAQLDMARAALHREEASKVSTWFYLEWKSMKFFVRNGNPGPIYDVKCLVLYKPNSEKSFPTVEIYRWTEMSVAPAVSDGGSDNRFVLDSRNFVLENTRDGERVNGFGGTQVPIESEKHWIAWDGNAYSMGLAATLSFRDSTGVYWQRDWDGKLTELSQES